MVVFLASVARVKNGELRIDYKVPLLSAVLLLSAVHPNCLTLRGAWKEHGENKVI